MACFVNPSIASTWPCLSHSASLSRTCPNFVGRSTRSCVTANSLCEPRYPRPQAPSLMGRGTWETLPKKLKFLLSLASFHPVPFGFSYLNVLISVFFFFLWPLSLHVNLIMFICKGRIVLLQTEFLLFFLTHQTFLTVSAGVKQLLNIFSNIPSS